MQTRTFSGIGLLVIVICAGLTFSARGQSVVGPQRYHWPEGGVSIVVPPGWQVNDASADDAYVEIGAPDGKAICGLHTGVVRFASASELADFMTEYSAGAFAESGLEQVVLDRHEVATPSGEPGVAVRVDILVGGRSQRVFYLRDGVAQVIDCESAAAGWDAHVDDFQDLIESFDFD